MRRRAKREEEKKRRREEEKKRRREEEKKRRRDASLVWATESVRESNSQNGAPARQREPLAIRADFGVIHPGSRWGQAGIGSAQTFYNLLDTSRQLKHFVIL